MLFSFRFLVFLALVAGFNSGCGDGQAAIIQARIDERVGAFRVKQQSQCRADLMKQAEATVDSLLLEEAGHALRDSLARGRPAKPFQPGRLSPIDTVQEVKPLFDQ